MHIHYSPPCSRLICAWVHCIHTYTPLSSHLHVTPPRRTESATCGRVARQLRLKTPHLRATRRGTLAQRMLNEMGQVVWSQSRKHGRKRRRSGVAGTGHTAPAHTVCSIRPSSPPTVNRAAPLPSGELIWSVCMCDGGGYGRVSLLVVLAACTATQRRAPSSASQPGARGQDGRRLVSHPA